MARSIIHGLRISASSTLPWLQFGLVWYWATILSGALITWLSRFHIPDQRGRNNRTLTSVGIIAARRALSDATAGVNVANNDACFSEIAVAGSSQGSFPTVSKTSVVIEEPSPNAGKHFKKLSQTNIVACTKLSRRSMLFRSNFKACFQDFPLDDVFTKHLNNSTVAWQKRCLGCHKIFRYDLFNEHILSSTNRSCRNGKWTQQAGDAEQNRITHSPVAGEMQSLFELEADSPGAALSERMQEHGQRDGEVLQRLKPEDSPTVTLDAQGMRRATSERIYRRFSIWRGPSVARWHSLKLPRKTQNELQRSPFDDKRTSCNDRDRRGRKLYRTPYILDKKDTRLSSAADATTVLCASGHTTCESATSRHQEQHWKYQGVPILHSTRSTNRSSESIISVEQRVLGRCVASIATRAQ